MICEGYFHPKVVFIKQTCELNNKLIIDDTNFTKSGTNTQWQTWKNLLSGKWKFSLKYFPEEMRRIWELKCKQ